MQPVTKMGCIMNSLVELYKGKEPRVKTIDLYKGFGYFEHRTLKRVILKNRDEFKKRGALVSASTNAENKKGRPDESYLLNERQFILLVMLVKNTPESVELKSRVEIEFSSMREKLAHILSTRSSDDWKNIRKDGKTVYFQKTNIIKNFVDYATEQGSTSAGKYYINLATMENKALFLVEQKFPNLREVMNIKQLMQIATADQIVEKALQDGMSQNLHYKDIYLLAKDRVVKFSEIIGKSQVIAMTDMLTNKSGA